MQENTVSADDAVSVIRDSDTVCVKGYVRVGTPNELPIALEKRFMETGHTRDLTLVFASAPGDGSERGLSRLAHEALVRRGLGGHWSLVPKLARMAVENRIEAYNLLLEVISQLYRSFAGGRVAKLEKRFYRSSVRCTVPHSRVSSSVRNWPKGTCPCA